MIHVMTELLVNNTARDISSLKAPQCGPEMMKFSDPMNGY